MMKVFYILFFILLDFLVFNFLVQKIKLNTVVKSVCVIFLLIIVMIHLLRFSDFLLSDKVFLILIFFTAGLFVFHFGKEISILSTAIFHNKEKSELLLKWFKIWTDYIIYLLVLLFQIATIINYEDTI